MSAPTAAGRGPWLAPPPIVIGPYRLEGHALLAPMAGVTDLPFRRLCRRLGAALAAGEMIAADPRLWDTEESRRRRDHTDEPEPRVVQIAGGDPASMAEAARRNVDAGAQVIDINMGCPAKKVCNKDAGSALLRDESHVAAILERHRRGRRRAGDAQDPHRMGARSAQCGEHRAHRRTVRASRHSPCMAARVPADSMARPSTRPLLR